LRHLADTCDIQLNF